MSHREIAELLVRGAGPAVETPDPAGLWARGRRRRRTKRVAGLAGALMAVSVVAVVVGTASDRPPRVEIAPADTPTAEDRPTADIPTSGDRSMPHLPGEDPDGPTEAAGRLVQARSGHTSTPLADGRVLVVGGTWTDWEQAQNDDPEVWAGAYHELTSAEVWDPTTGTSQLAGRMSLPRSGHTATLLPDGRVLVIGGQRGFNPLDDRRKDDFIATAEVWDPAMAAFTPAGVLSEPRMRHGAALLADGRVLVVGGQGWPVEPAAPSGTRSFREPAPLATAEVWEPATASFRQLDARLSCAAEAANVTATVLDDGRVLVMGARGRFRDGTTAHCDGPLSEIVSSTNFTVIPTMVEVFDPVSEEFSVVGDLGDDHARAHTATLLPDGRVLVAGGGGEPGSVIDAKVWDPATNMSTSTGPLPGADRFSHTATVLADGRVLLLGGGNDLGEVGPGAVWDPATGQFDELARPVAPPGISGHTAILLPDGQVAVIGGVVEDRGDDPTECCGPLRTHDGIQVFGP